MPTERIDFVQRQRALADFGELALRGDDLQAILDEACRIVCNALRSDIGKVVEIEPDGKSALVRAGLGWREGIVGETRISLTGRSSQHYAIQQARPMVTHDIAKEERFDIPDFMHEHGVVALVNTPIFLPGGQPYGLIEVDAREPREFGEDEVEFLRTCATILGPVIDRLFKMTALQRSDERFRLVVENARDFAIMISDPHDFITDWFAGAVEIFGWSEEEVVGRHVSIIFSSEDNDNGIPEREMESALAHGKMPDVRWHVTKHGDRVYLDGQTIALRNPDGSLRGFLKIAQDLTERKRNEERQSVLLAELQHRVRNVLAMVSAVVRRGDISGTTSDFRDRLSGRIAAMARTQALLTQGAGVGVDLEAMVREEMLSQSAGDHRFHVAGPPLTLAPKAAEVLTLAVHELATNASKYGAFAQPGGEVEVVWRVERRPEQDWLEFFWSERGVRLDPAPPQRKGFGTELVTRRVPYELRGSGDLRLDPDGLKCHIAFPLVPGESILQQSGPSGPLFASAR